MPHPRRPLHQRSRRAVGRCPGGTSLKRSWKYLFSRSERHVEYIGVRVGPTEGRSHAAMDAVSQGLCVLAMRHGRGERSACSTGRAVMLLTGLWAARVGVLTVIGCLSCGRSTNPAAASESDVDSIAAWYVKAGSEESPVRLDWRFWFSHHGDGRA